MTYAVFFQPGSEPRDVFELVSHVEARSAEHALRLAIAAGHRHPAVALAGALQ